jgi:hypothetical protein
MKPYGLTIDLQVTRPTRAEDAIWEAVKAAIAAGMTPRQFRIEAASAWEDELRQAAKDATRELQS